MFISTSHSYFAMSIKIPPYIDGGKKLKNITANTCL